MANDNVTKELMKDIIPAFRFKLIVNAAQEIPCKSVRAFTREFEYDYIQEGGINDYVHILRKQATKPFMIQIERYAVPDKFDELNEGTVFQIPLQLVVGENDGLEFRRKRSYFMLWPRVLNREFGALESERSGLLTETVTIAYSHLVVYNHGTLSDGPYKKNEEDYKTKRENRTTEVKDILEKVKKYNESLKIKNINEDPNKTKIIEQWEQYNHTFGIRNQYEGPDKEDMIKAWKQYNENYKIKNVNEDPDKAKAIEAWKKYNENYKIKNVYEDPDPKKVEALKNARENQASGMRDFLQS